jgi:hypothetical protein
LGSSQHSIKQCRFVGKQNSGRRKGKRKKRKYKYNSTRPNSPWGLTLHRALLFNRTYSSA